MADISSNIPILVSLGNDSIKADMFFIIYHSTFKWDKTRMVVYSLKIDIKEIMHINFYIMLIKKMNFVKLKKKLVYTIIIMSI